MAMVNKDMSAKFGQLVDNAQVMVTPLLLLFSENNLMMNCLPVCLSMFMIRSLTGSCGVGGVGGNRRSLRAPRSTRDPLVV